MRTLRIRQAAGPLLATVLTACCLTLFAPGTHAAATAQKRTVHHAQKATVHATVLPEATRIEDLLRACASEARNVVTTATSEANPNRIRRQDATLNIVRQAQALAWDTAREATGHLAQGLNEFGHCAAGRRLAQLRGEPVYSKPPAPPYVATPRPPARAAFWYYVVASKGIAAGYVDVNSLQPAGGKIIATLRYVLTTPRVTSTIAGKFYSFTMRAAYDCTGDFYRQLEIVYYDQGGAALGIEPASNMNEHDVPDKNTIGEDLMAFVCTRKGGVHVDDPLTDAPHRYK